MNELIQELLPYLKGFAGIYLIGYVVTVMLGLAFIIFVFCSIIKSHREFNKEFKSKWK